MSSKSGYALFRESLYVPWQRLKPEYTDMASYVENNPTESSVPSAIDKPSISPIAQVAKRNHSAAASTLAEAFVHDEVARYLVDIPEREHWAESQKYDLHFKIMDYLTVSA